jgi:hypothetical protein
LLPVIIHFIQVFPNPFRDEIADIPAFRDGLAYKSGRDFKQGCIYPTDMVMRGMTGAFVSGPGIDQDLIIIQYTLIFLPFAESFQIICPHDKAEQVIGKFLFEVFQGIYSK